MGYSNQDDGALVKLVRTYSKHSDTINQIGGTVLFSVALAFASDYTKLELIEVDGKTYDPQYQSIWLIVPLAFLLGVGLALLGTIAGAKDKEKLKKDLDSTTKELALKFNETKDLTRERDRLIDKVNHEQTANYGLVLDIYRSYKSQIYLWLVMVSQELKFSEKHRITIYYIDDDHENFIPLLRYSKSPKFNQQGRTKLSVGKCAISTAWQTGSYFTNEIPTPSTDSRRVHVKFLKDNFGYTQKDIDGLTMKSRSIAASAIESAASKHIGVVVFESTDVDLNKECLENLCLRENNRLQEFVQKTQQRERSLANRKTIRSGDQGGLSDEKAA